MRVLVIEDNLDIAGSLRAMLERRRFLVDLAHDGDAGLDKLLQPVYDLAIVDLVLPKRDGFSVCREARAAGIATPVLMLTARDAIEDRVRGLDDGADDYLVKPFVEDELAARIRALLRRRSAPPQDAIDCGELRLDLSARAVTFRDQPLDLRATEFRLLEYLAQNAGLALTRDQILAKVWDETFDGPSNIVDVYISGLRKKLAKLGGNAVIETVWGVGYKLAR